MKQDIEGLALLERACKRKPEFNLAVAEIYRGLGKEDNFRIYLERATSYYRERFSKDAKVIDYRFGLIRCLVLKNSFDEAIQIAEEGLRVQPIAKMKNGL